MAIDFGPITYESEGEEISRPIDGLVLKSTARIEPFVTPGEIWVTEAVKVLMEGKIKNYQCVEITPEAVGVKGEEMEYREGKFNISKPSEEKNLVKLYQVNRK